MKYPQLVSPRAVNAISDWLVSRLEQLGVESPQIYTRLLLSLLQSSVQVNDPIEFSNLEAFIANYKGGHSKRFHLPSDTETLKKLNAVQCLREIVSTEQETAAIERLVDELCEKLKDIEKRSQELNDEERFLIDTNLNIESLPTTSEGNSHQLTQEQDPKQQQQSSVIGFDQQHHFCQQHILPASSSQVAASIAIHSRRLVPPSNENVLNDSDNDPKKRYFRAFPALSKEMEDSFRIWRRNAKSLTWPVVGRASSSIIADTVRVHKSIDSSSGNLYAESRSACEKGIEKRLKAASGGGVVDPVEGFQTHKIRPEVGAGDISSGSVVAVDAIGGEVQGAAASAKKKSKRRRNQALCKGKPIQSIRNKAPAGGSNSNTCGSASVATAGGGGGKFYSQHQNYRNTTPAWDTDFKGCWEMGPDLIKEFLARQKGATKRSRSNSDSLDQEMRNEYKMLNEMPKDDELLGGIERPLMKRYIDLTFCCGEDDERSNYEVLEDGVDYVDEDYDDENTLASIEELTASGVGGGNGNARRLYQREGKLQKPLVICNPIEENGIFEETSDSVDNLDFANFKAKFNSSVEALWKDAEPPMTNNSTAKSSAYGQVESGVAAAAAAAKANTIGISSAFYATTSLNALAPFKQDLWNFWSNYNQHHYDQMTKFSNTTSTASSMTMPTTTTRLDDSSASSGAGADIANSSDYFSMPSNLDDFDKSVGAMRRVNEAGASMGAHTPSISVFLQNSIWSSSGDCVDAVGAAAAAETDESFLYKVWHSNKKLSQLDVGKNKNEKMAHMGMSEGDNGGNRGYNKAKEAVGNLESGGGAKLEFPPYSSLKWSEGINAGPAYNNLRSHMAAAHTDLESLNKNDGKIVSFNSAAGTVTGATWEAPAFGENSQPDLKSWCASNPMSLTEMYGSDVCDSITEENEPLETGAMETSVTLPNHCSATSGFIAYSRVKQCGLIQPQSKPLQLQSANAAAAAAAHVSNDYFRGGEEENLLTSERTHFNPIETYVDGHTFNISSALDSVDFERSASGFLCYDSNEYLEYTRNDIYLADEEVANTNLMNFSATASSQITDGRVHVAKEKPECREMFVLKFRLRRSGEIACQTEEIDFQLAAAKMANDQLPPIESMVEVPMFSHTSLTLSRQANNEAIMAAVTKAVAAAAKAAAEQGLNAGHSSLAWIPATRNDCTQSWVQDVSLCDEVDFCRATASAEQLSQFWSMQEVEKQCHQRRLPASAFQRSDLERTDDNSMDNSSHTLWGMCAVCNSCDYGKSLPANRLLRDELQREADEIMSDLRYMQDLYIGEADSVADTVMAHEVEGDRNSEILKNIDNEREHHHHKQQQQQPNEASAAAVVDQAQASMLLKVNQLIEDLLRPEGKTAKLFKAKFEEKPETETPEKLPVADWAMNMDDDAVDNSSSWHFGGSGRADTADGHANLSNIWQHEPIDQNNTEAERKLVCMKPMKLLRQVGGSLNEEDLYVDNLNWEHENLAKIWQRDTMPSADTTSSPNAAKAEHKLAQSEENLEDNRNIVEQKNLKNLQNNATHTPPTVSSSSNSNSNSAAVTYKRVQHFLNSSAAKLKLAANRKRRHSASQNFYHHQNQQQVQSQQEQNFQFGHSNSNNNNNSSSASHNSNQISSNNNNNNVNITDLNRYKKTNEEELALSLEPKQTIITCKYWTTTTNGTQASMDSAAAAMMLLAAAANKSNVGGGSGGGIMATTNTTTTTSNTYEDTNDEGIMLEDNTFGNTFSCLIDKNASILKHVMMTRPLTR
uniref:Uncharacterized protein n=1 Tax=Stomoxys calcitrans TaxID=35570 RepID=A0A1I8P154_STOCA